MDASSFPRLMIAGSMFLVLLASVRLVHSQREPAAQPASHSVDNSESRSIFAANCAGCHGLDGSGTQRAPNIKAGSRTLQLSSTELLHIISDGIPGTGMPSFRSLGETKLKAIADYIQQLQGDTSATPITGNPERGKQIFFGSGDCSSCHMVSGAGGFVAPDLTDYAAAHSAEQIKAAITKPEARDAEQHSVVALASDGREYRGMVRNEDNFSLQLQSMDGTFYFLSKSELQRIDRTPGSIMPSDYGSKLSSEEINDLVGYMVSASRTSKPAAPKKDRDED